MRETIGNPNWVTGGDNTIPGGLANSKEMVDGYYAHSNPQGKFKGCRFFP